MLKKPKNRLREWFDTLFYGILIAVVFRSLFLEPFNIPSGSMIPTLHIGDHIFITKWSYGYSRYSFPFGSWHLWNGRIFKSMPKVGDVIVFRNPKNESLDYVKRLIGLPGDTIQMRDGRLYINGEMVERRDPRPYGHYAAPVITMKICRFAGTRFTLMARRRILITQSNIAPTTFVAPHPGFVAFSPQQNIPRFYPPASNTV